MRVLYCHYFHKINQDLSFLNFWLKLKKDFIFNEDEEYLKDSSLVLMELVLRYFIQVFPKKKIKIQRANDLIS